MEFSRPEYWSSKPFPSPGDLPNPGIEPRSPTFLADSLPAEAQGWHKGSPRILKWVAYLFSSGSSRPRNWTGVSCIAGRFFTNWAIREAWKEIWSKMKWHKQWLSRFSKVPFRIFRDWSVSMCNLGWWYLFIHPGLISKGESCYNKKLLLSFVLEGAKKKYPVGFWF